MGGRIPQVPAACVCDTDDSKARCPECTCDRCEGEGTISCTVKEKLMHDLEMTYCEDCSMTGDQGPHLMPNRPILLRELLDVEEQWPPLGLEVCDNVWSELFVTLYNVYKSQDDESWSPKTWKELLAYA